MVPPSVLVRAWLVCLVVGCGGVWAAAVSARQDQTVGVGDDRARFAAFVERLKTEAIERGISDAVAARALDGLEPLPVVVRRDRGQAESVLSVDTYVRRRLTPATVRKARRMATTHHAVLEKVGETYGVQIERDHAALVESVRTGRVETLREDDL